MHINKIVKLLIKILPSNIQRNIIWYNNRLTREAKIKKWVSAGSIVPPPHQYKQFMIEQVSRKFHQKYFVETGTFLGHMIEAQRNNFSKLYSIEVEPTLYKDANKYFETFRHIKIVKGDSAVKLDEILDELPNKSILFWLDGHYSGENTGMGETQCPIYNELDTIFKKGVTEKYIMIDDARCFNGANDYPTIKELSEFINKRESGLKIEILNDIIHIY